MSGFGSIGDVLSGRARKKAPKRRPNTRFRCRGCGAHVERYVRPGVANKTPLTSQFCSRECANPFVIKNRRPTWRSGVEHHAWLGDKVSEKTGRGRALRIYREKSPCEVCGSKRSERHHVDGNTSNNATANIRFLCRRHHMAADGRLDAVKSQIRSIQPLGVAARWK